MSEALNTALPATFDSCCCSCREGVTRGTNRQFMEKVGAWYPKRTSLMFVHVLQGVSGRS